MTIPSSILLPDRRDFDSTEDYLSKFDETLKQLLDIIAKGTIGEYQTDFLTEQEQFIPFVYGASTAGTATYLTQYAWTLRRSLMTDIWFDLSWSAHTGSGDLFLRLPFLVQNSNGLPFVGTIQSSGITYAGFDGLVCNAEPNTLNLYIYKTGTGATTTPVQVDTEAVSGRLIGHVRYIGQEDEIIDT